MASQPPPPTLCARAAAPAAPPAAPVTVSENPIVTVTTSEGAIRCELYLDVLPITVSNFVDLAEKGFYNGYAISK